MTRLSFLDNVRIDIQAPIKRIKGTGWSFTKRQLKTLNKALHWLEVSLYLINRLIRELESEEE